jgi:tetratricopeptide (TPR) repeat protein
MTSRPDHSQQPPEIAKAWEVLESGDIAGALRHLFAEADRLPLVEIAYLVRRAAELAGFEDLRDAAANLADGPEQPKALYDFGYACIERGVSYLAVLAQREALRQLPESAALLRELVAAYEDEMRHREAADELVRHEGMLVDWPDRYLLVFNALMAGDLPLARHQFALLSAPHAPEDTPWVPVHARITRTLARAEAAAQATALSRTDLRGWQFVTGGSLLGTLSPYGFDAGMTGRYAWVQDSVALCRTGLLRLGLAVQAAGLHPRSVSLLPDRDSRILGLAAAQLLGLPAEPVAPGRADTLVIAYNLASVGEHQGLAAQLRERAPGQVLHEHAGCWTGTPEVTADSITLLHQSAISPWGERLLGTATGQSERSPADTRPEEQIAADIAAAAPHDDAGDGSTPADPDEAFTAFVAAVRATWLQGPRDRVRSSGPVPSSRFW